MSRVLIVTGGSRGLGAATCIGAAEQGYEAICVNYVGNKERADQVVAACEAAGAKAIAVQADITKEADINRLFETVDKELGTVTIWSTARASSAPTRASTSWTTGTRCKTCGPSTSPRR